MVQPLIPADAVLNGMEYYIETSIGLVEILPCPGLPSSALLNVASRPWARFISAEDAARAVAASSTGLPELDELWCGDVPLFLSDWKQSIPHYFATVALDPQDAEEPAGEFFEAACAGFEQQFAF